MFPGPLPTWVSHHWQQNVHSHFRDNKFPGLRVSTFHVFRRRDSILGLATWFAHRGSWTSGGGPMGETGLTKCKLLFFIQIGPFTADWWASTFETGNMFVPVDVNYFNRPAHLSAVCKLLVVDFPNQVRLVALCKGFPMVCVSTTLTFIQKSQSQSSLGLY